MIAQLQECQAALRLQLPEDVKAIGLDVLRHRVAISYEAEAEEVISYHARGIGDQIEELIRDEFPVLWSGFDGRTDIRGRFIGPGREWDDPPREIGTWLEAKFSWEK